MAEAVFVHHVYAQRVHLVPVKYSDTYMYVIRGQAE